MRAAAACRAELEIRFALIEICAPPASPGFGHKCSKRAGDFGKRARRVGVERPLVYPQIYIDNVIAPVMPL